MQGSMVRRTQELLGRVIRKPPLTERLLSKPPFRYLHDVIGEVIRSTGFMKGLYTETEMKSDNVKDKDAKIAFLQKAIDVVVMVTGESLAVKPARIVAGHEPERTNELLQAIAKCCLNKLSSDEAVQKVLAEEKADVKRKTPSSKLQNKESKAEEHRSQKEGKGDSEIKEKSINQEQKSKEELKEEESKSKESDKRKDSENRPKNLEKDSSREGEKHEKERNKSRSTKQGKETEKNRDKEKGDGEAEKDLEHSKERDKKHEGGREKDRSREKEKNREKEHDKREKGKDKDKRKERGKDGDHSREQGKDKKSTGSDESVTKKTMERSLKEKSDPDKESESPAKLSKPHSKGPRQRTRPGNEGRKETSSSVSSGAVERTASVSKKNVEPVITVQEPVMGTSSIAAGLTDEKSVTVLPENVEPEIEVKQGNKQNRHPSMCSFEGESASDAEGDILNSAAPEKIVVSESGDITNEPLQKTQRKLPRPSSARPAPPRIKSQDSTEVLLPERNGSAKIVSNVIIDKEEDDDDQFVVEAAPHLAEITEMAMETTVELEGDEKHGGLVKRILETKKDYEMSQLPKSEKEKPLLSEAAKRKEKDLVAKEIEKFRGSIQALCRSVLPLGKIMDYIQEDVDAMKNELQIWHNENKQLEESLQKEQGITDSVVEPLKAELAELDQLIKDEQDKICAKRANILKNSEKIQKMIHNINSRR